jgi:hypothetical protein
MEKVKGSNGLGFAENGIKNLKAAY